MAGAVPEIAGNNVTYVDPDRPDELGNYPLLTFKS
jgi:hypothetical protein